MALSLGFIAVYATLISIASLIEVRAGRGYGSVQLNLLIRTGSLAAAVVAMLALYGTAIPGEGLRPQMSSPAQ